MILNPLSAWAIVNVDVLIAAGLVGAITFYFVIRIGACLLDWHEVSKMPKSKALRNLRRIG